MKINTDTLKIEIDLSEILSSDFEHKIMSLHNDLHLELTELVAKLKIFKEQFESTPEYKKAFQEFCENKLKITK